MSTPAETDIAVEPRGRPPGGERVALTRHRLQPRTLLLRVFGEVDLGTAPRLRRELADATRSAFAGETGRHTRARVLCDLSGVTFLGAAGLAALLETDHLARAEGVELRVVAGSRGVRRVLALSGLDHHLDVSQQLVDVAPSPLDPTGEQAR